MARRVPAAAQTAGERLAEAGMAERWARGLRGPLRLRDGRLLHVIFPGVPGPGAGPDFTGAILDAAGDVLRGDVELHLSSAGWFEHGHASDPAYGRVVLHVVAHARAGETYTPHASGRRIPVLVQPPPAEAPSPGFTPPCTFAAARGIDLGAALERMSLRRLRMKAARAAGLAAQGGPGQALYALLLEQLGGSVNRAAFASIARWLPLNVLLERAAARSPGVSLERAIAAELRGAASQLILRRAGLRPLASPPRRLDAAAAYIAGWFAGGAHGWPASLPPGMHLPARRGGLGRQAAIEVALNAILPAALANSAWPETAVEEAWLALPSPGVYGKLRPLAGWLTQPARPFTTAARLQGGLLLHADYCTRGMCGRCPLSPPH